MGFEDEVRSISTADHVETSIGELTFVDGAPTGESVERVYDYLDTARGVEVFLNAMPGASVQALVRGPEAISPPGHPKCAQSTGVILPRMSAEVARVCHLRRRTAS